ncbi:MAG: leucine--tRNA ligase [Parcubacteria group bacterium]|nr:leucine--tRNA ligase [Parcubacteria group bacterium]
MQKYNHEKIEKKWQKEWANDNFAAWRVEEGGKKKKKYVLDMFPYPSGDGLHVGHIEGYTASDIVSRFSRMRGYNVLHPMGWDAFGLPTENYAIKHKVHPAKVTEKNVNNFRAQLQRMGFSYDWSREVNTTDPEYYKWTQWIFLELFKRGLAYEAEVPVNWCPSCKTVLANEEVIDGTCDRCHSEVIHKNLKQWILKITAYADRLLSDLDDLDWPERIKEMQRNWIGKSYGALIKFPLANFKFPLSVFTTRPDTLFGVTYVVLAPEHILIQELKDYITNWDEIVEYVGVARNRSERERQEKKEKTGIELRGISVINPANQKEVPVWIADYVLMGYGTGAVMAVPAHDERDFAFAKKYRLPITTVIQPLSYEWDVTVAAYTDEGRMVNSGEFDGLGSEEAKRAIVVKLREQGFAENTVKYKLRDWVFSRQRYWGEPIPLVFCEACAERVRKQKTENRKQNVNLGEILNPGWMAVSEGDLPVTLPNVKNYEPTGNAESPLAGITTWVKTTCPRCGGVARRETNTMPQWAGSSWYYLAYVMRGNSKFKIQNSKLFQYWLPVDMYIGGAEHAVLHLLYARFWHKVLYDAKIVSTKEPFYALRNQGLILGPDGVKMSKSRGNVINPDAVVREYGADTLRMFEMFMGPLEDSKPWDIRSIVGVRRFLERVWGLQIKIKDQKLKIKNDGEDIRRLMHRTIKKVTKDIEEMRFNTAISALMVYVNALGGQEDISRESYTTLLVLLAPFAPHITEELWQLMENKNSIHFEKWPIYDPKRIIEEYGILVVQVNGKTRDSIEVAKGVSEENALEIATKRDRIAFCLKGKEIIRVVYVQNKLINIVVK